MYTKDILWNKCLDKIEQQMLPENYATWFGPTYPHNFVDGSMTIAVPNDFYKKCLTENYLDLIEHTLEGISEKKIQVQFLVDPQCGKRDKNSGVSENPMVPVVFQNGTR